MPGKGDPVLCLKRDPSARPCAYRPNKGLLPYLDYLGRRFFMTDQNLLTGDKRSVVCVALQE